jgi:hypothetical protein
MKEIGLAPGQHGTRDVWAHADRTPDGAVSANVPSHSVAMFVVRR